MNYIVYQTTNLINGKIYVGVHRTNPDIFDGYIGCGVSKKDQKKKQLKGFPLAVKKYGYENFKRETLFIFPDTEEGKQMAYIKEKEIVNEEFVKNSKTYNLAIGGDHPDTTFIKKQIAQYTLDGTFVRVWNSSEEAQECLNLTAIRNCICGKSKYCGDWQWRLYTGSDENIDPVEKKEKSVYQFDLAGNLIKSYRSVTEASKQFKSCTSAKTAITNCCNKNSSQSFGFYWSYTCKFEYIPPYSCKTPVAKYDDAGNFLESYTSITEAVAMNKLSKCSIPNIIAAIKGDHKHCGGFRWRYFYGNTINIKPLR